MVNDTASSPRAAKFREYTRERGGEGREEEGCDRTAITSHVRSRFGRQHHLIELETYGGKCGEIMVPIRHHVDRVGIAAGEMAAGGIAQREGGQVW